MNARRDKKNVNSALTVGGRRFCMCLKQLLVMASSPGLVIGGRGEGERRPGIHCMCMRRYYSDFE